MLVFVYGTLKTGHRLHGHLAGEKHLGDAITEPRYRLFKLGWYPGLVEQAPGIAVQGEVWEVSERTLAVLDEVEEVDSGLYERRTVQLTGSFRQATVQTYLYLGDVSDAEDCGNCW
ncbi:MAG: gamma-glutamylcyclotransferase family protein [Planctomycetota bacterium]|jgi:gamma-glutamylcyclotransferase (GGCT)/AIG2-like uncharacterized protein YtfP